jgi:5-methylcytosine-specific restriction endonuclease McrA
MSKSQTGRIITWGKKISDSKKGIKRTKETTDKMRKSLKEKGLWLREKNPNWKGGITLLVEKIRNLYEYRQWYSDIFTRDNWTCQECGIKGGILNAHHIKLFSTIIEENNIKTLDEARNCQELWNINNGITLCQNPCHKDKHKKNAQNKNNISE